MTQTLLLISLGPVQDFIAQARRSRDLWFGSHVLSELSRAAAKALHAGGATLIFPALSPADLAPCDKPERDDHTAPVNVANKILASVGAGQDPAALAKAARQAAMDRWLDIADKARSKAAGLLRPEYEPIWDEQVETFLEFAATWAPLNDYKATREQLEQALASRKALRDFVPWPKQQVEWPKSSLDGARATVLAEPKGRHGAAKHRDEHLADKYRIPDGEQLDAIGVIKRTGLEPEQFVPLADVALRAWIDHARETAPEAFASLLAACESACDAKLGLTRTRPGSKSWLRAFPYDAQMFLEERWGALFGETDDRQKQETARKWAKKHVGPVLKAVRLAPWPYVACLVADGDRIGAALDVLGQTPEAHRTFSRALSGFAANAREIVEAHRGMLIYAGGDDVLAFITPPDAPACAKALSDAFKDCLATVCATLPEEDRPTLSVGIGIGHLLDGMGDLLTLGRKAEKLAKGNDLPQPRNALAVVVDKRSGGEHVWRESWNDHPLERLAEDLANLTSQDGRLPSKKVYEVRRDLERFPAPDDVKASKDAKDSGASWSAALQADVARTLGRTHGSQGISLEDARLRIPDTDYAQARKAVAEWCERLLIARAFAMAGPALEQGD